MSFRSKTLVIMLGLLASTTMMTDADAGNRNQRHRNVGFHSHGVHRVMMRPRVNVRQKVVINIDTRRHRYNTYRGYRNVRGVDTYSGGVDMNYQPGVGTWSYATGSALQTDVVSERETGTIIDVKDGRNDCSMEHGVCVIRP